MQDCQCVIGADDEALPPCTDVSAHWMLHQAKITARAIVEHNDGEIEIIEREFGAFERHRRALAEWAQELALERVVM